MKVNGTWHDLILVNVYKGDRVDLVYADGTRDMVYPYDTYMFRWRAPTVDPYVLAAIYFMCYENDRRKKEAADVPVVDDSKHRDDCQQRGGAEALAARP